MDGLPEPFQALVAGSLQSGETVLWSALGRKLASGSSSKHKEHNSILVVTVDRVFAVVAREGTSAKREIELDVGLLSLKSVEAGENKVWVCYHVMVCLSVAPMYTKAKTYKHHK
jgi:hypothetical protein